MHVYGGLSMSINCLLTVYQLFINCLSTVNPIIDGGFTHPFGGAGFGNHLLLVAYVPRRALMTR